MSKQSTARKPFREKSEREAWRTRNSGKTECPKSDADQVARLITKGVPLNVACDYIGIDRDRVFVWMKHGEDYLKASDQDIADVPNHIIEKAERYAYFLRKVRQAFAKWNYNVVINDINTNHLWQKGVTLLERRDPKNWGRISPRGDDGPSKLETFSPDPSFL